MTSRFALVSAVMALLLFSLTSFAEEENDKVQVFAGYSFQRLSTGQVSGSNLDTLFGASAGTFDVHRLFSGWNGELQYNFTSHYGVVLDASGHYGTPISAASSSGYTVLPRSQSYWYLIGPEARLPRGRFILFAHAMIGRNNVRANASEATSFFGSVANATSDGALGAAAGGGVDWPVKKHFAVRLAQVDYLYSRHTAAHYASSVFGTSALAGSTNYQNSLRFSAGLVYSFGQWK